MTKTRDGSSHSATVQCGAAFDRAPIIKNAAKPFPLFGLTNYLHPSHDARMNSAFFEKRL
ncbi:MAG: hypothetical protein JWP47_557 [Polaromonas sp.]|jgi:hypothetical protein|nr:hypothetical protein [Polaromonas sp.]